MLDPSPLAPRQVGGWTAPAVVSIVVGRLAHEFPDLPVGSIIAATVRTLHELRLVPLTTLRDAPFDSVLELVEEQTWHALCANDEPRVPGQRTLRRPMDIHIGHVPFSSDDLRVLRLLPRPMSFAEIAVALGSNAPEVKTRAIAIYRRLGVVSRAEAVERAKSLGLVP